MRSHLSISWSFSINAHKLWARVIWRAGVKHVLASLRWWTSSLSLRNWLKALHLWSLSTTKHSIKWLQAADEQDKLQRWLNVRHPLNKTFRSGRANNFLSITSQVFTNCMILARLDSIVYSPIICQSTKYSHYFSTFSIAWECWSTNLTSGSSVCETTRTAKK